SDRIGVMYLGKIVEIAPSEELFLRPLHPYTKGLIQSIPRLDEQNLNQTNVLEGEIPSPLDPLQGCPFHTRCPLATELCRKKAPEFSKANSNRFVACHHAQNV